MARLENRPAIDAARRSFRTARSGPSTDASWRVAVAGLALAAFDATSASAQPPDYFAPQPFELRFSAELSLRQEWTEAFGLRPGDDRRRARLLGGVEGSYRWLRFGLGGDFVYSSDDNVAGLGGPGQEIQRDNYRSRDARVDSVFLSAEPARWLRLEAGRFEMPIGFTGLVWDPDLRSQGAALSLSAHDLGALQQLSLKALGSRGGHVFDDSQTTMWAVAAEAVVEPGERSLLDLTAAFVTWTDVAKLERPLWRQNRVSREGSFASDYEVLDFVARLHWDGDVRPSW